MTSQAHVFLQPSDASLDWPLIGGSFTVNGIHVLWPRLLVKRLTEAGPLTIDVDAVHSRLATAFPQA